ncbi:MAG: fatty acid oxidation complex subunit alpha FadJ [Phycisphaera sp.]|nr:fatty acid oxidation complex subunit alpha FadJ [Phycisphaera sp.]
MTYKYLDIRYDHGVVIVTLDYPDRAVNTLSTDVLDELDVLLVDLEHGRDTLRGVVFTSAKPGVFVMGADLFEINGMNRLQMRRYLQHGQNLFNRVARLGVPTAAAINGTCLGGGCELALACDYRVAADDGAIAIGLPETKLGILPGWGGSTRLPRIIGVTKALPMMLAGKTLTPRKAQKLGVVDEVVRPEAVVDAAIRLVRKRGPRHQPGFLDRVIVAMPMGTRMLCDYTRRKTMEQTYGHYPAVMALIDVVETGLTDGMVAGFRAERERLMILVETPTAQNLIRLFMLRNDAKKDARKRFRAETHPVSHAAVVGGGTMGAGIVHSLIRAGISVRLIEVNHEAVSAALRRIDDMLTDDVRAKRIGPLEKKHAMQRVSPTTSFDGLRFADFVIEAVAEKMSVKRQVFARLDAATRSDTILATNTSSLSVAEIAAATNNPSRVIGLHFFNPVPKMPLVEVVRHNGASDEAMATGVELALRVGKTPIVVNDAPGFLVNRLLIPYLAEAMVMAGEGVCIRKIDAAMKQWGMPMGPFELLDTVGLDIVAAILPSIGGRLHHPMPEPRGIEDVVNAGMLGRKAGRGFYVYHSRKTPSVNVEAVQMLHMAHGGPLSDEPDASAIQRRLVLPMINEAARALGEQIVQSTDVIDLATVLGLGLAPFRGGLVHHAQDVGMDNVIEQMHALAESHGERFDPSPHTRLLLVQPPLANDQPSITHGRVDAQHKDSPTSRHTPSSN